MLALAGEPPVAIFVYKGLFLVNNLTEPFKRVADEGWDQTAKGRKLVFCSAPFPVETFTRWLSLL